MIDLAIAAATLTTGPLYTNISEMDSFIGEIHQKVTTVIDNAETIPGFNAAEFDRLKPEIKSYWDSLVATGTIEKTGRDEEIRPYFVSLQGIIEHVLSQELNKSVLALVGAIHTPAPATPLCTNGSVTPGLVDDDVLADPSRLMTVKARSTIVRDFLVLGGHLYILYPEEGYALRSEQERGIYELALKEYSSNLFNRPLSLKEIAPDMVGAFYLFKDQNGKEFAFAINIPQANATKTGTCALWFGESSTPPISNRIKSVIELIEKGTSPIPEIKPS